MKTTVKINVLTKEITMTKAASERARFVGSKEYEHLVKARHDFPDFSVKILSPKPKANSNKGLTMELMEKLVAGMTSNDKAAIQRFEAVKEQYRGTSFHFSKPKAYFLSEYPNWREWSPQVERCEAAEEEQVQERREKTQAEAAAFYEGIRKWA